MLGFRNAIVEFRQAFQSMKALRTKIRTDLNPGDNNPEHDPKWTNIDLLPSPSEHRNWGWFNYSTFFFGLSLANWPLGSSMIGIGLNWWQSIVVIFVSQMISSVATWYNSKAATVYHLGYPAIARSVFGMRGSFLVVGARAVLAIIWYGIQLYQGSSFVFNILHAIFGKSFTNIPNGIPVSQGFTTQQMIALIIFWAIHTPFIFLRPHQLRHFFTAKAAITLISAIGLFTFCMVNTKANLGSLSLGGEKEKTARSALAWLFIWCINSGMGNTATLITNQPDLARWARNQRSPMFGVLVSRVQRLLRIKN